jgi:hypothetical protein
MMLLQILAQVTVGVQLLVERGWQFRSTTLDGQATLIAQNKDEVLHIKTLENFNDFLMTKLDCPVDLL